MFYAKKLCTDARTLAEVVGGEENLRVRGEEGEEGEEGEGERKLELSVMVLGGGIGGGGAKGGGSETAAASASAKSTSGTAVLQTGEFWDDLKGFLIQRLKDEDEGTRMAGLFQKAWGDGQK